MLELIFFLFTQPQMALNIQESSKLKRGATTYVCSRCSIHTSFVSGGDSREQNESHRAFVFLGIRMSDISSLVTRFRYDMCREYY